MDVRNEFTRGVHDRHRATMHRIEGKSRRSAATYCWALCKVGRPRNVKCTSIPKARDTDEQVTKVGESMKTKILGLLAATGVAVVAVRRRRKCA